MCACACVCLLRGAQWCVKDKHIKGGKMVGETKEGSRVNDKLGFCNDPIRLMLRFAKTARSSGMWLCYRK